VHAHKVAAHSFEEFEEDENESKERSNEIGYDDEKKVDEVSDVVGSYLLAAVVEVVDGEYE
jgi:hypothetical protein